MANPFSYTEFVPTGAAAWRTANLELQQWATDVQRYGFDRLVFSEFLTTRTELGVGRGGSIIVPIMPWDRTATGTTELVEGSSIIVGTPTLDNYPVVVGEYGYGYTYPRTQDFFSNLDNRGQLLETLGFNFAVTWDALAYTVFSGGAHGMRTIAAGSLDTGTAPAGLGGSIALDGTHIDEIYGSLVANQVPKFPDGLYRWVGNWSSIKSVAGEAGWQNLQLWNRGGQGLTFQDLGAYKGFRWISTEENTSDGTSFAFGPDVGVQAFASPVQIRHEPDFKQDFQRLQAFAWYIIGGVARSLGNKGTYCYVVKTS